MKYEDLIKKIHRLIQDASAWIEKQPEQLQFAYRRKVSMIWLKYLRPELLTTKRIIKICTIGLVSTLIVAYIFQPMDMAGNITAEIMGIFASIILVEGILALRDERIQKESEEKYKRSVTFRFGPKVKDEDGVISSPLRIGIFTMEVPWIYNPSMYAIYESKSNKTVVGTWFEQGKIEFNDRNRVVGTLEEFQENLKRNGGEGNPKIIRLEWLDHQFNKVQKEISFEHYHAWLELYNNDKTQDLML